MIHVGLPLLSVRFAGLGSNWWQGLTPRAKQAGQPADAGSVRCVDVHHELRRPMKHAVGPAEATATAGAVQRQMRNRPGKNRVRGFQSRRDLPQIVRPFRLPTGLDQKHGGQPSRLLPSMRQTPIRDRIVNVRRSPAHR
jgi:hypothetical protein